MKRSLAVLATALLCGCTLPTYEQKLEAEGPLVRLYFSPLPIIGFMAVHPWFITHDGGKWNRWEVWHVKNLHGRNLHVYKNLHKLNYNTGWGDPFLEEEWAGEEAGRILEVLDDCRTTYPHKREYWPWPGPNSNAFASWVLEEAGIKLEFPFRALGDGYR